MPTYTNGTAFVHGETAVTDDVLASIKRIWLERRSHINCAGPNCCKGCELARQIPWLLDLIDHLRVPVPVPDREIKPLVTPCPEGFHWIGQPFTSCDGCGLPAWEHEGMAMTSVALSSPYDAAPWVLKPWGPGEREACRAKWDKRAEEVGRGR